VKKLWIALLAGLVAPLGTIGAAEANTCRALEMQLSQLQFRSRGSGEAAAMQNLLIDRGCRGGRRVRAERKLTPVRLERTEKRVQRKARQAASERKRRRKDQPAPHEEAAPRAAISTATYRTLCVRTCDGYYFPISFSTTKEHFSSDQATCQAMCSASETALYVHASETEGPQDMVSLDGALYTSLPTAFRHHQQLDRSCTCNAPRAPAEMIVATTVAAEPVAPLPLARPEPGEDPETAANRLGSFVPGPVDPVVAGAPAAFDHAVRNVIPLEPTVTLLTPVPN
jgi:hypothetical protein